MGADVGPGKLKMPKPAWYQAVGKYAYSDFGKSSWQLLDTFVPYCVLWPLMLYTVREGYPYWVTLVLAVVAGGILVTCFYTFSRLLSWVLLCVAPGKHNPRLRRRYFNIHTIRRLAACPQYTSCDTGRR